MHTSAPRPWARTSIVVPAALCLLLGLVGALVLLGIAVPAPGAHLSEHHATLMVFGFVGTLIALERAVALRAAWAWGAPLALVVGTLITLSAAPLVAGASIIVLGMAVHNAQYVAIWRRQPMTATCVQAAGAVTGLIAALAWAGGVPIPAVVPALIGFLVLTIAGERWELARLTSPPMWADRTLFALAAALATCCVLALVVPDAGVRAAGGVLIALIALLLRHDVVRTTIAHRALPRYVAVCLLLGYGWLIVTGAGWLAGGAVHEVRLHDATTHAALLGFVMTMIMAHAPVILPAVLGVRIPYRRALYVPVVLMQVGLVLRILFGDLRDDATALRIGGVISEIAIIVFGLTVIVISALDSCARRRDRDIPTRDEGTT